MSMKRKNQIRRAGLLFTFLSATTFVTFETAFADANGRAGRTGAVSTAAGPLTCASAGCHAPTAGAILPTLTIAGPATLVAGATGSYTATLTGGPGITAGINIAAIVGTAKAGTFVITEPASTTLSAIGVGAGGRGSPGEVIHSAPKPMVMGSVTFIFDWTAPATPGSATLFAAGLSTNDNTVTVPPTVPPAGETGDELALAQYVVTITPAPNLPPVAIISAPAAPATGVAGMAINFDATGSNDPDGALSTLQYSWDFGDGTPVVAGLMASHTFATAGPYTVSLSVTDSAAATTLTTLPITISAAGTPAAPVAVITGGPTFTGTVGTPLMLSGALSSDADGTIVSYAWTFGDGTISAIAAPSVTYATAGAFAITLTVTDNAGLTGTATATANITAAPPTVTPTAGQTLFDDNCSGCHGPAGVGVVGGAPNIVGEDAADILEAFAEYPVHAGVLALTPAEVQEIATYLAMPATIVDATLFVTNCESCHGVGGVGIAGGAPNIVGEDAADILEAFQEYAAQHVDVAGLPATDIQLIADFLATGEAVDDDALKGNTNPPSSSANKASSTSTQAPAAGALDWLTLMIPGIWLARRRIVNGRSKLN